MTAKRRMPLAATSSVNRATVSLTDRALILVTVSAIANRVCSRTEPLSISRGRGAGSLESTVALVASQGMSQALLPNHHVAMNRDSTDKLTVSEFLGVFGCPGNESRRMSSADAEEYLTLVKYLLERGSAR
jgi:hypothetical protein